MTRRLAEWEDYKGRRQYGIRIKPFWIESGTYGYMSQNPTKERTMVKETLGAAYETVMNTIAALSVDWKGTLALIPFAFVLNGFLDWRNWETFKDDQLPWTERVQALGKYHKAVHGLSGVYNIVAGYLAYHGIFEKGWLPIVTASKTMVANLTTLGESDSNDYAHYGGFLYGFVFAALVNQLWRKQTVGIGFLRRHDILLTGVVVAVFLWEQIS